MMKNTAEKIYTPEDLKKVVENWQTEGKQVVFTNGCFDIVHLGHIDYLEKARQKGDKLVVGLNSDNSVKILKGKTRPIIPQYARARMLAALEFVDAVVLFSETTPQTLIETLKPNVLTKGNDYSIENIVGADFVLSNGGRVETLPLVDGFSTSQIIEKVKQSMLDTTQSE